MRIIAGEYRGRHIEGPAGRATRPMLDRVREALFSTLGPQVDGALVLDLFAGTGSLGLEALSRGAARVRCVERHGPTRAVLVANARALGCAERVEATGGDALAPATWQRADGARYDLVCFDPPYPAWRDARLRARIDAALEALIGEVTLPGAVIAIHAPRGELAARDFPKAWRPAERTYGSTALWYLETPAGEGARSASAAQEASAAERPAAQPSEERP